MQISDKHVVSMNYTLKNDQGTVLDTSENREPLSFIVGKGMIRRLKELDDSVNIVPIDYDPGATKVNQENRIKLMLSSAYKNLNK